MKAQEIKEIKEKIDLLLESQRRLESLLQSVKPAFVKVLDSQDWLMTARETAGYLGVSVETVYKWTKDGKLRKFRRGGRTGYLKSELDRIFMVE